MPGLLGAGEAAVRRQFEVLLTDRCSIVRTTLTPDGQGGSTETPANVATDVPCTVSKTRIREVEMVRADRETAEASYTAILSTYLPRWSGGSVDIRASDRLVVTGEAAGEYEIQGSGGPESNNWVREIRCLRLE